MKLVIAKTELLALIGKLQSVVSNKPAISILSNVLVEAIDDQLILSATDLTTSMRCYCEATIISEGAIALPAKRFFQLIREISAPQIKISCENNETTEISAGSSTFKINGMNKNEFPSLPEIATSSQINFPSSVLKEMLSKTSFCAARDDARRTINGVCLRIANKKATFYSTDGKRLCKVDTFIDIDPSFTGSYIIPIKAVEEMTKILEDSEALATLCLMPDKACLETKNLVLITKLLAGQYPDIDKVIPSDFNIQVNLHREELITILKQISLFTLDVSGSVRFILEPGVLELQASEPELGQGVVSMPADYSGARFEIAFNPYYFIDALRHSKEETIRLSIKDPHNPGVITDSSTVRFVLMPMRLKMEKAPEAVTDAHQDPAFA